MLRNPLVIQLLGELILLHFSDSHLGVEQGYSQVLREMLGHVSIQSDSQLVLQQGRHAAPESGKRLWCEGYE